ncbi:GEM-like protein 5 isoform X2 [Rhodamnia argentea]|uniref:GEM-like protein 5 isoform X2 n=1 Tax=Rhodamnia argentea TaxID=178133 RepID=A0ABM3GV04_9MYRT|nr:GEM-like protein 5 isoform X2 [Rhodamnia argentea]
MNHTRNPPNPLSEKETNPFSQEPPSNEMDTNPFHQEPPSREMDTNPFHREPSSLRGSPPLYPPVPASAPTDERNPFHQEPKEPQSHRPSASLPPPAEETTLAVRREPSSESIPENGSPPPPPPPPYVASCSSSSQPPCAAESAEKWGTHVMGTPAVPTIHPDNKKAAFWGATEAQAQSHHHPYLQYNPIERSSGSSGRPMENILHMFNSWSHKAENVATNVWQNLKTGSSVSGAAWAKVNLRAKAITGGGFESLYKQTFATYHNEMLRKTFACYLSTTTGPVAGTLYLSNFHAAFCSDRPLSFTAPSGQVTWSYYKVMVPLGQIGAVNPVVMRENQSEKYLQIVTFDGHDFWFMGFVNYEKATRHLTESISTFAAPGVAVPQLLPPPPPPPHAA